MKNISSLGKVEGVILNQWFIPNMFISLELDNTFVLWSNQESEYFINTEDNLLQIRYFRKQRLSIPVKFKIHEDTIEILTFENYIDRITDGEITPTIEVGQSIIVGNQSYRVQKREGNMLTISYFDRFKTRYNGNNASVLLNTDSTTYIDKDGVYWAKNYLSRFRNADGTLTEPLVDVYIDGKDIRSIVGRYY